MEKIKGKWPELRRIYIKSIPWGMALSLLFFAGFESYGLYCAHHSHKPIIIERILYLTMFPLYILLLVFYGVFLILAFGVVRGTIWLAKAIADLCSGFSLLSWFNLFEAFLWIGIGTALFYASKKYFLKIYKKNVVITAFLFLFFGISDAIEIYTGVWWSPWWLLLWKILNGISVLWFTLKLLRFEKLSRK